MAMDTLANVDVRLARGHIELRASCVAEARKYARSVGSWANQFDQEILIFYPESTTPIRIPPSGIFFNPNFINMTNLTLPRRQGIITTAMRIAPSIQEVFDFFSENPDLSAGLVRLSDERQVSLTDASALLLTETDGGAENMVTKRRSDYWFLPDLEEFNRNSRQLLEPDNRRSRIEVPVRTSDPFGGNWLLAVNEYRLITDDRGELYHVCITRDCRAMTSPVEASA